jgi:molecular chaperone DnaJ
VPEKLSHEAKELLRKFDEATSDSLNAAKKYTDSKNGSETKKKKKLFDL